MKLKKVFFYIMFVFLIAVPLFPFKYKLSFIPVSADFVLGFAAIFTGFLYVVFNFKGRREDLSILRDRNIIYLSIFTAAFSLLSIASITYSVNKSAAISEIMRFMEYALLFYFVLILSDRSFIKRGLRVFYVSMIIAAVYGIIQFAFNLSEFKISLTLNMSKVSATFENPNYWGAAVNLVIFIPIIGFFKEKKNRLMKVLIILLLLVNSILSFTRGSWIGFLIGLGLICILEYRAGLISLPVIFISGLILPFTRRRILSIFVVSNASSSGRLLLWKTGYLMFKEHFWLGVGNGNYLYRYKEYITKYPELNQGRDMYSVHNSYLKMLAELGIFGGLIFTIVYLQLFAMTFKAYKRIKDKQIKLVGLALIAFWGAYLFQNFLNNLMFIPQLNILVWVLTAMVYKWLLLEEQEEKL